jgi:small ligand-binding sensory domain FIST
MTAAVLPDVRLELFHVDSLDSDRLIEEPAQWHRRLDVDTSHPAHLVLLADPFSCDARGLLSSLDSAYPDSRKVGGLASGASRPGDNALFIDDDVWTEGVAGLLLNGDIAMDTIVAQGCRPIGPPLFITNAVRNRILELDGRRPTELLGVLYDELSTEDRKLFRHSLFLGMVMNEGRSEYSRGDFLVRNLVGVEPESGVITVGELVQSGQVVQFHLRDADTSAEDLDALLREYKNSNGATPDGALLFSCLGRGEALYGMPDHDSRMINDRLGEMPIGGFFCNGEIGPVDRRTFVHGYTSSIALFRQQES